MSFAEKGARNQFFLKCRLGSWSCLSFPGEIQRRKRNSTNLFQEIEGKKVVDIKQFENERAFSLLLSDGYQVVFMLFGHNSNILIFQQDKCVNIFRKKMIEDLQRAPADFERNLSVSYDQFSNDPDIKRHFPTFGKQVLDYLENKGIKMMDPKEKWDLVQNTIELLENPEFYYVCKQGGQVVLMILPAHEVIQQYNDPLEASTDFFNLYLKFNNLIQEKSRLERNWKKELVSISNYLNKSRRRLDQITEKTGYKEKADLIMAHLDKIPKGAGTVNLLDFYGENLIHIVLKPLLSAQQNAVSYYRKGKNQSLEIRTLKQNIAVKEKQLATLNLNLKKLENVSSIKELNSVEGAHGFSHKSPKKPHPFMERTFKEYKYLIGKSANQNDLLLQLYAQKNDLWLHVKDAQGSHVIIRQIPGQNFPKSVIQKGAQLASYYSKRKSDTWCPVSYTLRKNVRKRKKDPPGAVRVEQEEVILVQPSND